MPTIGAFRVVPPVDPQKGVPPNEKIAAVGGDEVVAAAARRGDRAGGTEPGCWVPPALPGQLGVVVELGPRAVADGRRAVRPGDLVVLDVAVAVCRPAVAGDGDADACPFGSSVTSGEFWKPDCRPRRRDRLCRWSRSARRRPVACPCAARRVGRHEDVLVACGGHVGVTTDPRTAPDWSLVPERLAGRPCEGDDGHRACRAWTRPRRRRASRCRRGRRGPGCLSCSRRASSTTAGRSRVLNAFTVSESEAPPKYDPVPTTIPVAPPARNPPTAGDGWTVWLVS